MSSKKWLVTFFATAFLMGAAVLGLNFLADPFGVFPGSVWEWPAYEMTINPRTAKISYLEEHHQVLVYQLLPYTTAQRVF